MTEWGDPAQPTVLLVHGFPDTSAAWLPVAELLADRYHTVAYDVRGAGRSSAPSRTRDYRLELLVADLNAVIDATSPTRPVHLVGHDWGANNGWLAAAHRPDLVRTWTAISVPHPAAFRTAMFSTRQAFSSWYMGAFQVPRVPERVAAKPGGRFDKGLRRAGMTREDVDRFHREVVEYGALPGGLNWYRAMPFTQQRAITDKVQVPTTMLWSDGDTAINRVSIDRCAEHVTGPYELRVLEGASHWLPAQEPQAVADAVLSRIGSG